ncbi:MAG: MotA/TolQ/ExbB proton channel family protein [Planctomycetota bacterium]|jgi:biopolymer transport protein ExbB/TolQ
MDFEQLLSVPLPSFRELLERGGGLMIPLLVLNFLAWIVVLERAMFWLMSVPGLVREKKLLKGYLRDGAGQTLEEYVKTKKPKAAGRLLSSGTLLKPAVLFQTREPSAWEEEADAVVGRSEKLLTFLTLAATLGTSLGLLGTVIGVSSSLKFIESDFSSTVAGLSVALYTTVGGLIVSIQAALFYGVFQSLSNALNESIGGWVRRLRQKPATAGGGS